METQTGKDEGKRGTTINGEAMGGKTQHRPRHWCLPHCPGQTEFVNYSLRASGNCLACPTGQVGCIYFGLTF